MCCPEFPRSMCPYVRGISHITLAKTLSHSSTTSSTYIFRTTQSDGEWNVCDVFLPNTPILRKHFHQTLGDISLRPPVICQWLCYDYVATCEESARIILHKHIYTPHIEVPWRVGGFCAWPLVTERIYIYTYIYSGMQDSFTK